MGKTRKALLQRFNGTRLAAYSAHLFIRLYSRLYRFEIQNDGPWRQHLESGGRVVMAVWHRHLFFGIWGFQRYVHLRPVIMISRSSDGEVVANTVQHGGWHVARGSSSSGGASALNQMIGHIRQHGFGVHVVDGPRGPAGRVKKGLVTLAHATGAAIVPAYATVDRCWYLRSWDRFMIPKPGARVTVVFSDLIHLEASKDQETLERQRVDIETVMRRDGWDDSLETAAAGDDGAPPQSK